MNTYAAISAYLCGKNDLIIANSAEVHKCADFGRSSVCCIVAETSMLSEFAEVRFDNLVRFF